MERRLYLVADKAEIDRRKRRLPTSRLVEVWQDLYTPDILWLGDDEARRVAYGQKAERPAGGLFWVGEASKAALDEADTPLPFLLAVQEEAVPVYYGPRLSDVESLPLEESLKARVLSAHGIAVVWATYGPSRARAEHRPADPTDPTFYLRRPRGSTVHVWHLFRTRADAVTYASLHLPDDPEAQEWVKRLPARDFDDLIERFGQRT